VIITNRANLYYPELLAELSQQLTPHGKRVLLFPLASESEAAACWATSGSTRSMA
jgi:DNA-binding LacI/PurR family transcriptional regulator